MKTAERRTKGTGGVHYLASRGLYVARLDLPPDPVTGARRRKQVAAKTEKAALKKLRDLQLALTRSGDLPTASPTVRVWLQRWITDVAYKRLKPKTWQDYRSKIELYVIPAIGRVRLDKLTPAHVRQVETRIVAAGLSTTTALNVYRILSKALKDAVREGLIPRNPAELTDAPRKAVTTQHSLSAPQAMQLLAHLEKAGDTTALTRFAVSLLTGMRQGEVLGLTREMVDLDAGTITVAWQLQRLTYDHGCGKRTDTGAWPCGRVRGGNCPHRQLLIPVGTEAIQVDGAFHLLRPKSRAGWRRFPAPAPLLRVLSSHMDTLDDRSPDALLFTRPDGRPIEPADDNAAWHAALDAAGLPSVKLHSARHTAVTVLHALGVSAETRQRIVGHSSAAINAVYVDSVDAEAEDAMRRLGETLWPQLSA